MTFIWRGLGSCTNPFMAHNAPPVTIVAVNSWKLFQRSSPPCAARTRASNSFTFFSFTRRWSTKAGGANLRPTLPYKEKYSVYLELTHPIPGRGPEGGLPESQRLAARNKTGSSRISKPRQHAHIERYHVVHLHDVRAKQRCCRSHARIIDQHRNTGVGLQPFLDLFKIGFSGKIRGDDLDRPACLALQ